MKNLKCQIRNLENITVSNEDYTAVEKELQLLGKKLLTEYVIKIGNIEVEPLWVEAYYYDQNKFPDCNTHMSDKQKNRFGQLYFHEKGRGGLDICLSAPVPDHEDYYLSVLLKATLLYETGKRITDGKAFKK